jgi:hypothetical protein
MKPLSRPTTALATAATDNSSTDPLLIPYIGSVFYLTNDICQIKYGSNIIAYEGYYDITILSSMHARLQQFCKYAPCIIIIIIIIIT